MGSKLSCGVVLITQWGYSYYQVKSIFFITEISRLKHKYLVIIVTFFPTLPFFYLSIGAATGSYRLQMSKKVGKSRKKYGLLSNNFAIHTGIKIQKLNP